MTDLRLEPSQARRVIGVIFVCLLGGILLSLALGLSEMAFFARLLLIALAIAAFYLAVRTWYATARHLVFDGEVLRDDQGRVLCELAEIARIERGPFAFKPSNGFLIRTKVKRPGAWQPGLWWRLGKQIGVGGVTPSGAGKAMADMMSARASGSSLGLDD